MSATIRKSKLGDAFPIEPPTQGRMTGIRIVKSCDIVSDRERTVLKTIADMRSEIGRMSKLADQLEAELLRASD